MNERKVEEIAVNSLTPYKNNARTHSPKQVEEIARSIQKPFVIDITDSYVYGFTSPVLADEHDVILAGHGKKPFCLQAIRDFYVMAAKLLGMETVPVLRIENLTAAEKKAYILADNKLAEKVTRRMRKMPRCHGWQRAAGSPQGGIF